MGVNSLSWFYTPVLGRQGEEVSLDGDEWHHCYNVHRMQSGDSIILCDGKGQCFEGTIRSTSAKSGRIELQEDYSGMFRNPRSYRVSIGIAPTKNMDKTEFAVEKLVEMGVEEICFLDTRHGERTYLRMDRIQKIIIAASKQSRKINFPSLSSLQTPKEYISLKQGDDKAVQILVCHLDENSLSLSENYLPGKDVVVLIGPEGGFSNEEVEWMKNEGGKSVHLGPFRLRVETAAIVACAGIHLLNQMHSK